MQPVVVITADIIDSRLHPDFASVLKAKLNEWLLPGMLTPFSIAAGDEIQAVCECNETLPVTIRKLRWNCQPYQIRMGVGFGEVDHWDPNVSSWEMNGSAFHYARTALEVVSKNKTPLTQVNAANQHFTLVLNTIYPLLDRIVARWSREQWAAVAAYENEGTYEKAASILGISRQNVQKRCKAAQWDLVCTTEEQLGRIICSENLAP